MKLIYGTDLSPDATSGARLCAWLSEAYSADEKVQMRLVHAVPRPQQSYGQTSPLADDPDIFRRLERGVRNWIDENIDKSLEFDVIIEESDPADLLEEQAVDLEPDYIVLGQTGKGAFARMMIGSTSHQMAQSPPCKLLLAHRDFPNFVSLKRICVAVDFDLASTRVLAAAAELARKFDAKLSVIHAYAPPMTPTITGSLVAYTVDEDASSEAETQAETKMKGFIANHDELLSGLDVQTAILAGTPTRQIVGFAKNCGADILCVATRSNHTKDMTILGSIASGVVRQMPTTVLLVPPRNRWEL